VKDDPRSNSKLDDLYPEAPPSELLLQISSSGDRKAFSDSVRHIIQDSNKHLTQAGFDFAQFKRVLDFGCGVGKFSIGAHNLGFNQRLFGCDIDKKCIEWCKNNLAFLNCTLTDLYPPLPYESASFDYIFALSVFTHMRLDLQFSWARELYRVLKPRGVLQFSTHGPGFVGLFTWISRNRPVREFSISWLGGDAYFIELEQEVKVKGYFRKKGENAQGQLEVAVAHTPQAIDTIFPFFERRLYVGGSPLGSGHDIHILQKMMHTPSVSIPEVRNSICSFAIPERFDGDIGRGITFSFLKDGQRRFRVFARLPQPGVFLSTLETKITVRDTNGVIITEALAPIVGQGTRLFGDSSYFHININIGTKPKKGLIEVTIKSRIMGTQLFKEVFWCFPQLY
jgi:SAM-dependent methyltransferase